MCWRRLRKRAASRCSLPPDVAARGPHVEAQRSSSTTSCRAPPPITPTASAAPAARGAGRGHQLHLHGQRRERREPLPPDREAPGPTRPARATVGFAPIGGHRGPGHGRHQNTTRKRQEGQAARSRSPRSRFRRCHQWALRSNANSWWPVMPGARPPPRKTRYSQGYLCREPARTVRVRVAGEQAFLTIKGPDHRRHAPSSSTRCRWRMLRRCSRCATAP